MHIEAQSAIQANPGMPFLKGLDKIFITKVAQILGNYLLGK